MGKKYVCPVGTIQRFVANDYVTVCEKEWIVGPDVPDSNKYPSSTHFYIDGLKDGVLTNDTNGILDADEKKHHTTTNGSGSTGRYEGIRKGWLKDDTSVEIEIGMMQNQQQWMAYKKGSLTPVRS